MTSKMMKQLLVVLLLLAPILDISAAATKEYIVYSVAGKAFLVEGRQETELHANVRLKPNSMIKIILLQLNEAQVYTATKMAKNSHSKLVIPLYPLAPKHTAIETYDLLDKLYSKMIEENPNSNIVFAGDSAGGGLALGFAEYLLDKEIKNPDKLILISPWVDISMENEEIDNYIDVDPMLNKTTLLVEGEMWKGNLSNKDYRVSPIYGKMQGLGDIIIFTGTREILFPDAVLLQSKLKESGVNSILEIGENMNHVYVGYPIKEADEAMDKIIEFVK